MAVNKRGHPQTLVAAHPGNRNAVKSGVFSPATLAPRIQELEIAISERRPEEVAVDFLERELAALGALAEAMDESFASSGVIGRMGEPRTLVNLRLRLNDRLRKTLDRYVTAERAAPHGPPSEATGEPANDAQRRPSSLAECIADQYLRESIADITLEELDPEPYLYAVITTNDPAVTIRDRLRARQIYTKRRKNRHETCLCFSSRVPHDELEFRSWIDDARQAGLNPDPNDPEIAAIVRQLAAGKRLEPPAFFRKTEQAFTDVVADGPRLTGNDACPSDDEIDPTISPFADVALSPRADVSAKDRLEALVALDAAGALPRCKCNPEPARELVEARTDRWYAYTVRLVAQRHYRAALGIASYPETYLAVRDAIDARVVATLASAACDVRTGPAA
jgi:hypothetical protein